MRDLIDLVTDRHELIGFDTDRTDSWQQLEVEHEGRTYRVLVPVAYDNGVERILRVDDCGAFLYLFGEVGHDHRNQGRIGCVMVARPQQDGTYRAFIFHSLFPRTVQAVRP